MEAALWELTEGDDSEEVRAIIRLHRPDSIPPNVRVVAQFGSVVICQLKRGEIVEIRNDETVASMKAPTLLTPGDEVALEAETLYPPSPESDNRRPLSNDGITGRGVVVGVVDWGCDFTHPNFRHQDGSTRLLALWDQSAPYDASRPNRYGYGIMHTAEDINRALASGDPAATLGYFFSKSDPTGSGTHGTHVLDIAAGNGRAGGPVGVAPEADLVFVHLHNQAFPSQVNLGDSVAVLEAADLILTIAQGRPVVMNFSMGRQMGPHDGSTLVEQGFDAILTDQPGRAIVQSTGNYFDRMAHSSGQVLPGQVLAIPFMVSEADVTPNEMEIWYPGRDVLTISVRVPNGLITKETGLDDQATIRVKERVVCKIYHRAREPNNLDNNCHIYIENGAPPGQWEVILTGIDVVDGRFNIWIERDATCRHCQSQFDRRYVVPLSTTGTICNGLRTIAVGAYSAHDPTQSLGRFSSSGPTRDGRRKPNLIAPGVQVLAARSSSCRPDAPQDFLVRKSGTSMAAPHVVGTVALMFDLANRRNHKLAINDTLNLLLGSTTPVDAAGDESHRVGSGRLNADAAIDATRDFLDGQFSAPVTSNIIDPSDTQVRTIMTTNLNETVAGEAVGESQWLETVESVLDSQMPVQEHFQHVLERAGLPRVSSLRDLFMMFARPGIASLQPQFARMFEVIAVPGGVLVSRLRPGDILLRQIPGKGGIHVAFISSENLLLPEQAVAEGWTLETMGPGYYGIVVEAGAFPHRQAQRYARCLLDLRGVVPSNQVILRARLAPRTEEVGEQILPEDLDEGIGLEDDEESVLIEDIFENNPPPMTPTKLPMAVPSSNPAPFAPLPPVGCYWPIITNHRQGRTVSYIADDGSTVGQAGLRWLADRSGGVRYHVGIDLFANLGDPVVAIEDGEIINFYGFCCGTNKTTNALFVAHSNVVVNYGEVAPDSLQRTGLSLGSRVRAGQIIAYVGRNPGGSSMIHLETYTPGTRSNAQWMKSANRPSNLLNPTRYLLHLQEHGLVGTGGGTPGTTPPVTPSTPGTTGSRSSPAYIQWVQSSLNQVNNAGLVVDGINGPRTREAVRNFQRSRGLTADGIVGPQTEAALVAAGASPPPTSAGGIPTPIPPVAPPGTATDVSPTFVALVTPVSFSNGSEINNFFQNTTGLDFVDWFNARIAGQGDWNGKRIGARGDAAAVKVRFTNIWNRLPDMFGSPSINLFQFLSLMSIIINETGGTLIPCTERVGRTGHPGIAYAFDRIPDLKRSYNTGTGNRTALTLFNDPDFLTTHGSLPLADRVRNTTDVRWGGDQYPQNDFPTDPSVQTIIHEADFFKFRGRGLIQTTFRSAYKHLIEHIRDNPIAHPIIEDYRRRWTGQDSERIATITTNADWDRLFQETDLIIPTLGIRLHSRRSGNYLNMPLDAAVLNGTGAGSLYFVGLRVSGSERYGRLFKRRVIQMLNALGNS